MSVVRPERNDLLSAEETRNLFLSYIQTGDIEVRNKLVELHMPIVHRIAQKYVGKGVDYDDLVQTGCYALIKAVERYDSKQDVQFVSFAIPTMVGEIKHYFRDKSWAVRVPRRIKQASVKIHGAIPRLMQDLHRTPLPRDIATYLNMSEEEVLEAMEFGQAYRTTSLNTVVNSDSDDKDITLLNMLGEEDLNILKAENRAALAKVLSKLGTLERKLVYYRFFEELSQRDVGQILGMSQMQVSRLQRAVLAKLRQELEKC